MPSPIRKTTPEVARQYLEELVQNPSTISDPLKVAIQIVRSIRLGTPLPATMRGRVPFYQQVLQDPVLRAAVYRVLDERERRGKVLVEKWRVGFRINGKKASNNSRRRPPAKGFRPR